MFVTGLFTFILLLYGPGMGEVALKHYPRLGRPERNDRVLIVAPHVDDEAIGAGGYALDAVASGADVYVVFLTAGDCNRFSAFIMGRTLDPSASNYLSVGRTRIAEAQTAMQMLGIPSSHFFILGYPDGGLKAMLDHPHAVIRSRGTRERSVPYADAMSPGAPYSYDNLMSDMRRVLAIAQPTTVIAPVAFDIHPDHSAAAELTDRVLSEIPDEPNRLGYLVHNSRMPKSLVRIPERALLPPMRMRSFAWATYPLSRDVQRAKDALLQSYKSQRPYTYILRNAFVRSNELFFVPEPLVRTAHLPLPASAANAARLAIAN